MKPGERELHLGLDAHGSGESISRRTLTQVPEQRGLADPGFAAKHKHPTLSRSHVQDEAIQRLALSSTTDQASHRTRRIIHDLRARVPQRETPRSIQVSASAGATLP